MQVLIVHTNTHTCSFLALSPNVTSLLTSLCILEKNLWIWQCCSSSFGVWAISQTFASSFTLWLPPVRQRSESELKRACQDNQARAEINAKASWKSPLKSWPRFRRLVDKGFGKRPKKRQDYTQGIYNSPTPKPWVQDEWSKLTDSLRHHCFFSDIT